MNWYGITDVGDVLEGPNMKTYKVTNRHVVRNEQKGHQPHTLSFRMNVDPNNLAKNVDRCLTMS